MTMKKTLSTIFNRIETDDVLHILGLERRRSSSGLAGIGLITFGAVIGAGAALLFAPEKGSVLREQIAGKLPNVLPKVNEVVDQVKTGFAQMKDQAETVARQGVSAAGNAIHNSTSSALGSSTTTQSGGTTTTPNKTAVPRSFPS